MADSAAGGSPRQVYLDAARSLSPLIEAEAARAERGGTLTPAVVDALKQTRLFWMALPADMGGGGLGVADGIEVLEEVTRADGSTGWSLMASSASTAIAVTYLADPAIEAMYAGGEPPIAAGMLGPGGRGVETAQGLRGSGRYSFGSGCAHAGWIGAGMLVIEDGAPRLLANGAPEVQVCYLPKDQVEIEGNWDVWGLVGTGSYDYRVPEQTIPRDFTLERQCLTPQRGGGLYSLGIVGFGCAGHAAVALGLMKRALEEIATLTRAKKRPAYPTVVGDSPLFLQDFATHEALYQAARAFVLNVFRDAEATALAGGTLSAEQRARFRQSTTWVHKVAADVVRFAHLWAGSDAIRNDSVLGRVMRDMHVATQHMFVDPMTLVDAGPALVARWAR